MYHRWQRISIASSLALALLAFVAPGVRASSIPSFNLTVDGFNGDSHVNLSNCDTYLSFCNAEIDGAKVSINGITGQVGGFDVPINISPMKFNANGNEIGSSSLTIGSAPDEIIFSITNAHLSLSSGDDGDDGIKGVLTGTLTLVSGFNFSSSGFSINLLSNVGTFTDTMTLYGDPSGPSNFNVNFAPVAVPEPASLTLWGAVGLVGAWYGRRKMQRTVAI